MAGFRYFLSHYTRIDMSLHAVGAALGNAWATLNVTSTTMSTLVGVVDVGDSNGNLIVSPADFLELEWAVSMSVVNGTGNQILYMGLGTTIAGASLGIIPNRQVEVYSEPLTAGVNMRPVNLKAWARVSDLSGGSSPGVLGVALMAAKAAGGDAASTVTLSGPSTLAVRHWVAQPGAQTSQSV